MKGDGRGFGASAGLRKGADFTQNIPAGQPQKEAGIGRKETGMEGAGWDRLRKGNDRYMKRRVVVTGLGAVTPIGNTVEEFWNGIREGKVGIGPITKFDASEFKVQIAAEVKGFVAKERMDFKAAKRMEPFSQYAVAAAKDAFEDAGIDMSKEDPFRCGVIVGSGIGSLQCVETNYEKIITKGPNKVNPLMVPLMISNMAAGNISIQLGLKGKCTNVVTACASGTHCIGDAFRAIQYGDADVMVAGGTEASVCPTGIAGFTALTTSHLRKRAEKEQEWR